MELYLRYFLELLMVAYGALFSLLPVRRFLKHRPGAVYGAAGAFLLVFLVTGPLICVRWSWSSNRLILLCSPLFFLAYHLFIRQSVRKKLFCLFNAAMLCAFCTMYSVLIAAPVEQYNESDIFLIPSSLIDLGVTLLLGITFFRTLSFKLPALLEERRLNGVWTGLLFVPFLMTGTINWMIPRSNQVLLSGRVRPISIFLMLLIQSTILLLYHLFWWTTKKLTESARLQQENDLLQLERKRYESLQKYMEETRALRHDFRQHLLVIDRYAREGALQELVAYLNQLTEGTRQKYVRYCPCHAVDAVAAHYTELAEELGVQIDWRLDLPPELPIPEVDYCAVLGNLLENAILATAEEPPERRQVRVISRMLSEAMLGVSVDNDFSGELILGGDGLPLARREGHGVGLASVAATVHRYDGSLEIRQEDGVFMVDILLYANRRNGSLSGDG